MSALDDVLEFGYTCPTRVFRQAKLELSAIKEKLSALEYGATLHAGELMRREANNEELRARETCTGCGISKLDAILAVIGGAAACCPECSTLTMDERSAIRARVSETKTVGTALSMLAAVEHDDRLRAIEEVLPALRARLAAAEAPRTCATCRWLENFNNCNNPSAPVFYFTSKVTPENFRCIHHAPLPPGS